MINRVLLLLVSLLLFYSCEEEPDFTESIFENANIVPVTTLITTAVDPSNSTVTFFWQGNDFAKAFNYKLVLSGYNDYQVPQDYFEWLEDDQWTNSTSVTFEDLDEGTYTFSVKSRFDTFFIEPTPKELDFTIDVIDGPALRMYPLRQTVAAGDTLTIYLMAEDISSDNSDEIDVFAIESQLRYDDNLSFIALSGNNHWNFTGSLLKILYDNAQDGEPIQEDPVILVPPVDDDTIAGSLIVSAGVSCAGALDGSDCVGLSGSGAIMKFQFQYTGTDPGTIDIESALLANPFTEDENDISPEKMVSGSFGGGE